MHEVAGSVTVHSVVPPAVNVTVPVAPAGRPVAVSVCAWPSFIAADRANASTSEAALVTANDVVALVPR